MPSVGIPCPGLKLRTQVAGDHRPRHPFRDGISGRRAPAPRRREGRRVAQRPGPRPERRAAPLEGRSRSDSCPMSVRAGANPAFRWASSASASSFARCDRTASRHALVSARNFRIESGGCEGVGIAGSAVEDLPGCVPPEWALETLPGRALIRVGLRAAATSAGGSPGANRRAGMEGPRATGGTGSPRPPPGPRRRCDSIRGCCRRRCDSIRGVLPAPRGLSEARPDF